MPTMKELQARVKELEQQIAEQSTEAAMFKAMVENTPDAVGVGGPDGKFLYNNRATYAMFGYDYDEAEMTGMEVTDAWPEEARPMLFDEIMPAVQEKGSWSGEAPQQRKDGTIFPTYMNVFPVQVREGEPPLMAAVIRDITEQKQREGELAVFKAIVENSIDAIDFGGKEGTLLYANKAAYDLFGYDAEQGEMVGIDIVGLWPQDRLKELNEISQQAFEGGWSGEITAKKKDGSPVEVSMALFPVQVPGDEEVYTVAIIRDVTERTQREYQMARLNAILDNTSDLVVMTNAESKIVYANTSVMETLGYEPEEVIGATAQIFAYAPDDDLPFDEQQAYPPGFEETGIWMGELPLKHKDGHPIMVSEVLIKLEDKEGNFDGLGVLARDVTERNKRESHMARLNAILDNTSDLVIMTNAASKITYANASVMTTLGYKPEEVIGETAQIFAYSPDDEELPFDEEQPFPPGFEETGLWTGELPLRHKDGHPVMVSEVLIKLEDEQGNFAGLGVLARDVTEIKAAEAEREQMQQEIIDAQKRALAELSTPTVPVLSGVVVMPLSGTIDTQRSQQIMEALLMTVVAQQAEVAIVDITGVPVVDTSVAHHLLQVGRASEMLGAEFMLVGISAEVAQTIVSMGVDLTGIATRANLQSGIEYALGKVGKKIVTNG